jgi:hypothetical protein
MSSWRACARAEQFSAASRQLPVTLATIAIRAHVGHPAAEITDEAAAVAGHRREAAWTLTPEPKILALVGQSAQATREGTRGLGKDEPRPPRSFLRLILSPACLSRFARARDDDLSRWLSYLSKNKNAASPPTSRALIQPLTAKLVDADQGHIAAAPGHQHHRNWHRSRPGSHDSTSPIHRQDAGQVDAFDPKLPPKLRKLEPTPKETSEHSTGGRPATHAWALPDRHLRGLDSRIRHDGLHKLGVLLEKVDDAVRQGSSAPVPWMVGKGWSNTPSPGTSWSGPAGCVVQA